jgi:Glycosyltransferase family 9 (heptosyltransferase)
MAWREITRRSWELNCLAGVPSDQARWLVEESARPKWVLKYLKRWLYVFLRGQRLLEQKRIPTDAERILWVNMTAPSLGDALMDTSGRSLLAGRCVHLLTSKANAALFADDDFFEKVFVDANAAALEHLECSYDLAIIDSYSPRSISKKIRVSKSLPFVGLYGYLNGFEVHRTLYSFHRLGLLLGLSVDHLIGRRGVHHCLGLLKKGDTSASASKRSVCIGVGGEWPFRIYRYWAQVLERVLDSIEDVKIFLLGSDNGLADATALTKRFLNSGRVFNLVGTLSIDESCRVLRKADLYVGADGGLWHMASGCGIPTIALFADCALFGPEGTNTTRASPDQSCISLSANREVSEIDPHSVSQAVQQILCNSHATRRN